MLSPCETIHFAKQLTHNNLHYKQKTVAIAKAIRYKQRAPSAEKAQQSEAEHHTNGIRHTPHRLKKLLEMRPQAFSQTGKVTPKGLKPLTFRTGI